MNRQIKKSMLLKSSLPKIEQRETPLSQPPQRKIQIINDQVEVMKKIKNKLRMRKCSSNVNDNQCDKMGNTYSEFSTTGNLTKLHWNHHYTTRKQELAKIDMDAQSGIQQILEKDINVLNRLAAANISRYKIKEQLKKDIIFITYQINKGKKMEEAIVQRIDGIIQSNKLKERIKEKQKNLMAMMEERITKLSMIEKPQIEQME